MKKTTIFFLALLCLIGKELYGQEVAGHPPVPSNMEGAPVVVYGTVNSDFPSEDVLLTFFPVYLFNSATAPGANVVQLSYSPGNMIEGRNPKEMGFDYVIPHVDSIGYMSLAFGNDVPVLDKFLIRPGDTLEIYIDRQFPGVHFSGNAAKRMGLQYELTMLDRKNSVFQEPIMVVADPEKITNLPDFKERYEYLIGRNLRHMQFITPGRAEIDRMKGFFPDREKDPLAQKLELISSSGLPNEEKVILTQNAQANAMSGFISHFNLLWWNADKRKDEELLAELRKLADQNLLPRIDQFLAQPCTLPQQKFWMCMKSW